MIEKSKKRTVIICDLDNCLSDDGWRTGLIDYTKPADSRYETYHDHAEEDQPNKELLAFLKFWLTFPENRLIFLTARPERIRKQTRLWLDAIGLHSSNLIMRPDGVHKPSPELKADMLLRLGLDGKSERIATIIDDRKDVLQALHKATCAPTFWFAINCNLGLAGLKEEFLEILSGANKDSGDSQSHCLKAALFLANHGRINLPDSILAQTTVAPEANLAEAEKRKSSEAPKPIERFGPWTQPKLYNTSASSTDSIGERVAKLLEGGAATFRERNATYGSNFRMVGPIMQVLFPAGVPPELLRHDAFHLFELIIVKLSRFAISNFTHQDSIHDATVYAAMIEAVVQEIQENASE